MGAYLEKPVTDIEEDHGEGPFFEYVSTSMQGWRLKQEDAHICQPNFDPEKEISLFAVFDGHGGQEVSQYCAENLSDHIKADLNYAKNNFEEALRSSFISFDSLLKNDEVAKARLWELSDRGGQESPEEDPEDFNDLLEEASMPLEAVMAKYKLRRETGEGSSAAGDLTWEDAEMICTDEKTTVKKELPGSANGLPDSSDVKTKMSNGETKDSADEKSSGGDTLAKPKDSADDKSAGGDALVKPKDSADEKSAGGDKLVKPKDSADDKSAGGDKLVKPKDSEDKKSGEGDKLVKPKDSEDEKSGEGDKIAKPVSGPCGGSGCEKKSGNGKSSGKSSGSSSGKSPMKKRQSDRLLEKPSKNYPKDMDDDDTSSSSSESSDADEEEEEECEEVEENSSGWDTVTSSSECSSDDDDDELPAYLKDPRQEDEPGVDSGTTAVVALLSKERIIVANVGDSRAILGRLNPAAEGSTKPLTLEAIELSFDHKPELPEEKLRVTQAGGYVDKDGRVDGGLNLSRALGDHMFKQREDLPPEKQKISAMPDIHVEELKLPSSATSPGDQFLFIACDGIWNELSSQEAADFIWERMCDNISLTDICKQMFSHCIATDTKGDGTGCDNMTAVLVSFSKRAASNSSHTSPDGSMSCGKKRAADDSQSDEFPTKKNKM